MVLLNGSIIAANKLSWKNMYHSLTRSTPITEIMKAIVNSSSYVCEATNMSSFDVKLFPFTNFFRS